MKIIDTAENTVRFADLENGEVFRFPGDSDLRLVTMRAWGHARHACASLRTGAVHTVEADQAVIRVPGAFVVEHK